MRSAQQRLARRLRSEGCPHRDTAENFADGRHFEDGVPRVVTWCRDCKDVAARERVGDGD